MIDRQCYFLVPGGWPYCSQPSSVPTFSAFRLLYSFTTSTRFPYTLSWSVRPVPVVHTWRAIRAILLHLRVGTCVRAPVCARSACVCVHDCVRVCMHVGVCAWACVRARPGCVGRVGVGVCCVSSRRPRVPAWPPCGRVCVCPFPLRPRRMSLTQVWLFPNARSHLCMLIVQCMLHY